MMLASDIQIREAVLREIKWDTCVQVAVYGGTVTLSGTVDSHRRSLKAHEAAQRAEGVFKVVNDIKVVRPAKALLDAELEEAVRQALLWDALIPDKRIRSNVSNGWVSLEGEVDFVHEREDAERLVRRLRGVRGVYNEITVNPSEARTENVQEVIEEALKQRAEKEARHIRVSLRDGRVTLSGTVQSWEEERAIIAAAARAPGVQSVNDHLSIKT